MSLSKMKTNLTKSVNSVRTTPIARFKLRDGSSEGNKRNPLRRNVDWFVDATLSKSCRKQEKYAFDESYATYRSNVPGITSGRFMVYVQKFGKVIDGHTHRVVIVYTPYGFQVKTVQMFSTQQELKAILKEANPKLA